MDYLILYSKTWGFFLLLNTKEDILSPLTSIVFFFFSTMEINGAKQPLVPIIPQNIFLCVQQKKETHTGFKQLEGDLMMTEFSFLGGVSL